MPKHAQQRPVRFVSASANDFGGIIAVDEQGRLWWGFKGPDKRYGWELIPSPTEPST